MANLKSVVLEFENGTQQVINVNAPTMIQTPFGSIDLSAPPIHAVTPDMIASNPGQYENTQFDPTLEGLPTFWNDSNGDQQMLGSYGTWANFYKANPDKALEFFKYSHAGHDLNMNNLSDRQRQRLGK